MIIIAQKIFKVKRNFDIFYKNQGFFKKLPLLCCIRWENFPSFLSDDTGIFDRLHKIALAEDIQQHQRENGEYR